MLLTATQRRVYLRLVLLLDSKTDSDFTIYLTWTVPGDSVVRNTDGGSNIRRTGPRSTHPT